eukprot:gene11747-34470_t
MTFRRSRQVKKNLQNEKLPSILEELLSSFMTTTSEEELGRYQAFANCTMGTDPIEFLEAELAIAVAEREKAEEQLHLAAAALEAVQKKVAKIRAKLAAARNNPEGGGGLVEDAKRRS